MAGRISNTAPKNNRPAPAETSDWRGWRGRPARRARGDEGLRRGEDMRSMGIRMLYGRDGNGADDRSKPAIIAHRRAGCGAVCGRSAGRPPRARRSWQSVGFDIRCPHPQGAQGALGDQLNQAWRGRVPVRASCLRRAPGGSASEPHAASLPAAFTGAGAYAPSLPAAALSAPVRLATVWARPGVVRSHC